MKLTHFAIAGMVLVSGSLLGGRAHAAPGDDLTGAWKQQAADAAAGCEAPVPAMNALTLSKDGKWKSAFLTGSWTAKGATLSVLFDGSSIAGAGTYDAKTKTLKFPTPANKKVSVCFKK